MKITITLTRPNQKRSYDIQVSHIQKIEDTLQVLKENLPMFADIAQTSYVKDAESGRKIDIHFTYEQARIYSGTKLLIP